MTAETGDRPAESGVSLLLRNPNYVCIWAFGGLTGYDHKWANYATKNPADPKARLRFFYERSPYFDERWRLYPVGRER